jgi:Uma2 family endonuclease
MSTLAPSTFPLYSKPLVPGRRYSVQEYHQMIAAGILTEDDPVELLEGWIVPKMPRNPLHDGSLERCLVALTKRLPPGWKVRGQMAITTTMSEPEPDAVVARGDENSHLTRHPEPQEIALVIEVSDSSLAHDRGEKARAYAREGIVCYWIVNLVQRQVEVYTDPSGPAMQPAFAQRRDYLPGDAVPLVIAGQQVAMIPVADLLP